MRRMRSECRECKARGWILLENEGYQVRIVDQIRHRPHCHKFVPRRVTQPTHLRKRGWVLQERKAAEAISGRTTMMSGAANNDADARKIGEWRVECKQTKHEAYTVTQAVWTKLVQGAKECGEKPALAVLLGRGTWKEVTIYLIEGSEEDRRLISSRIYMGSLEGDIGGCLNLTPPAKIITLQEFRELVKDEGDNGEEPAVH